MYFEFQMSAAVLERVVRNRLRSVPIGLDLSIPDPYDITSRLVVDQVIIGDSTVVRREKSVTYDVNGTATESNAASQLVWVIGPNNLNSFHVPYLQLKQEVIIKLVRESDLAQNGPAPTDAAYNITVFPLFNVGLTTANQTQGGGPITVSYTPVPIKVNLPNNLPLENAVNAQLAQILSAIQIPSSTIDLSFLSKTLNRPVNAINAGIACDPAGTRVSFRVDFDVDTTPNAVTRNFFEAGPADLLAGKDWAMLVDANAVISGALDKIKPALEGQAGMRVLTEPEGRWDAASTTLHITAGIRLLGVCPGFVDDIDMDFAIDVGAHLSVTPGVGLDTPDRVGIHYQLDKSLLDNNQVFGCALTGALLYPIAGTALFAMGKLNLLEYLGGIGFGPFFTFGQLVGVIAGQQLEKDISNSLIGTCHKINDSEYECSIDAALKIQLTPGINSRFTLELAHGVPEGPVLSGMLINAGEIYLGGIEGVGVKPFKWQVLGHCTGNGRNNFHVGNEAKIYVDYIPPAKVINAYLLPGSQFGYTLVRDDNEITITPSNPPVNNDCKVRIITNWGVRTITLPAAKPLSDTEAAALKSAQLSATASCYYWEKIFTPKEKIAWVFDPVRGVDRENGLEHWQILIKNANPRSVLKISAPNGVNIMTLRPSRNGSFHATLNFAGAEAINDLTLELQRAPGEEARPLETAIHQTQYALRAKLPVQGEVRGVKIAGSLRRPRLQVTTQSQVETWDLTNPLAPHLHESVALPDSEDSAGHVCHTGRELGIAITPAMLRALERLADVHGRHHSIGAPRVAGVTETLYLRTESGTRIYDISDPEEPLEMHTLSEAGWYEQTASGLNLMARYNPDSQTIDLYEVAGRQMVAGKMHSSDTKNYGVDSLSERGHRRAGFFSR